MDDKPRVLFLHGLGDTESVWQPVIARLLGIEPLTVPVLESEPGADCGGKDRPNLSAARYVATAIPQSRLEIIPGAGHQWHKDHPDCFAATLKAHLSTTCG